MENQKMSIDQAIKHALDEQAVLFVGSGFSYGSKNMNGAQPKMGDALATFFASQCGIAIDKKYSLEIISEFYKNKFSARDMISLLESEYTITSVSDDHVEVLSVPWIRVYTTNYDHVVEIASEKNGRKLVSITSEDTLKGIDPSNVCVHINGDIDRLTTAGLDSSFRLTDRSYSSAELNGKESYELFKKDLQYAKAVIIIGYSAQYDIDIKRLLSAVSNKVVFINGPSADEVEQSLVSDYGSLFSIGIGGLASQIKTMKEHYIRSPFHNYVSFQHVCVHSNGIDLSPMTYSDLIDLFSLGTVTEKCFSCNSSTNEYNYLVQRNKTDIILDRNRRKQLTVVVSSMGNGKSVFLSMLKRTMFHAGYQVFKYLSDSGNLDNEIRWICDLHEDTIVIIDNYERCLNVIQRFGQLRDVRRNLWFIVSSRTQVHNKTKHTLRRYLNVQPTEILTVYLDEIDKYERITLAEILCREGLLTPDMNLPTVEQIQGYIETTCHNYFSELLLNMFHANNMINKMNDLFIKSKKALPNELQEIGIFILLLDYMNLSISSFDMLDIFGIDVSELSTSEYTWIDELLDVSNSGEYKARSSVIAKEFLMSAIGLQSAVNVLVKVAQAADCRHKGNSSFEQLLKNIVSHSHFIPFRKDEQAAAIIMDFYERVRHLSFYNQDSLFWTQYAAACIDGKSWDPAKHCIETALTLAKSKPNFLPYQTETVYGRYTVERLQEQIGMGKATDDQIVQELTNCQQRLAQLTDIPENNPSYTIQVYNNFKIIWDMSSSMYSKTNLQRLLNIFVAARSHATRFQTPDGNDQNFIGRCKESLTVAITDMQTQLRN